MLALCKTLANLFVDAGAFRADKRFETQPSYYYDFAMQPTVEPRIEGRNSPPPSHPRRAGVGDRNRSALPLATRHVNTNDPMLAGRQEREEAEEREEETRDREVAAASAAAAAEYLRERAEARAAERHATVVSVDRSQIPTAVPVPPGTGGLVQAHATPAKGGSQQWRESMAVGDVIDAKDSEGRWFDSRIVAIEGARVKVHYNGWSSRWDSWFDRND